MQETLVLKTLPQDPTIEVLVPNYKEPILPVNHGGFGWYGLQAYNQEGQLMCHECGTFWDSLGCHAKIHGLNPHDYRLRYGLRMSTRLTSAKEHAVCRKRYMASPSYQRFLDKFSGNGRLAAPTRSPKNSLEALNARDSCPQQVLRRLVEASEVYGASVTIPQCRAFDSSLYPQIKRVYGSFNKAKQLVKLVTNAAGSNGSNGRFTEIIILEDMCAFFERYHRWPRRVDYIAHLMLCSFTPVRRHGGIESLRQEAMKLKETQDAATQQADRIPAFAESIERQYAGSARV